MLNELAKEIYDMAAKKGWHDKSVAFGDAIANIHGELSEAFEDYRNNYDLNQMYYECKYEDYCCNKDVDDLCESDAYCDKKKPCGIPSEFADVIIRILDNCHMYNIDIDKAIKEKMEFNKTRPYKHGGKLV